MISYNEFYLFPKRLVLLPNFDVGTIALYNVYTLYNTLINTKNKIIPNMIHNLVLLSPIFFKKESKMLTPSGRPSPAPKPVPIPDPTLPKPAPKPRVAQVNQEQEPAPAPAQPSTPVQALTQTMTDPAGLAALTYATTAAPARTQQDAINDMRALRKESGVDQPMGVNEAAQQRAQDAAQKRQQDQAEKLAYAAFVQGTVGTPGSASLAYQRTMANALGNESAYGQQKYKNIAELETARRGLAKDYQTGLESTTAADRLASAAAAKDKANTGANLYGTEQQVKSSKYNTDQHRASSLEIAKLRERGENARAGTAEARQTARELRDRELSIEADIKSLVSQRNKLSGSFTPEDRRELANVDELLKNARAQKELIRGGPAAPAGTITPPPPGAVRLKKG